MSPTSELMLLRIALGHLSALADRPYSEGNAVGFERNYRGAQDTLRRLREQAGCLVSRLDASFAALFGPNERSQIPPKVAAQALRAPLTEVLQRVAMPRYAVTHSEDPCDAEVVSALDRVLVIIGPSLGLGDEVMFARALMNSEGFRGVEAEIWTTCPDVWRGVGWKGGLRLWSPDPQELIERIEGFPKDGDGSLLSGLITVDFYGVDPTDGYFFLPEGYVYVGSVALGSKVVSVSCDGPVPTHHVLNWHSSWPLSFEGICLRFVSFLGFRARDPYQVTQLRPRDSNRFLYINPFTSKPYLVPDPRLYGDALMRSEVLEGYAGIRVLSGPGDQTRLEADRFVEQLRDRLAADVEARVFEARSIHSVVEALDSAGLIVGPDTFTVHLGSAFGIPNVAVSHFLHGAWAPLGGACLRVRAVVDQELLQTELIRTLRWASGTGRPASFLSSSTKHLALLDRASGFLRRYYCEAHEISERPVSGEEAAFYRECADWLLEMQDLFPECDDRKYGEIARFAPRESDRFINASAWLWAWLSGNLPSVVRVAASD